MKKFRASVQYHTHHNKPPIEIEVGLNAPNILEWKDEGGQ